MQLPPVKPVRQAVQFVAGSKPGVQEEQVEPTHGAGQSQVPFPVRPSKQTPELQDGQGKQVGP